MTADAHHRASLAETARLELERAHRAALAMDAGEMRRGLELALVALRDIGDGTDPATETVSLVTADLTRALADLYAGRLSELGALLEAVRKQLA